MIHDLSWDSKEKLTPIVEFINEFATKEDTRWSWVKNWDCKYINIRIDMRSGHFLMFNNNKERISLDDLKKQEDYK